MTHSKFTRARGFSGSVRADATDPNALLTQINVAFEAFKTEHNEELAGVKAGMADVVKTEKVDRINADITKMNTEFDKLNAQIAAIKLGGGGSDVDPDKAEHAQAFNKFFRKGVDAGLSDLEIKAKLNTQSDPDSGYLVPVEMETAIDRVLGTVSTVRSLARSMNISTDTYKKLINVGGTSSGWVGESEARGETNTPKLREIAINTAELYANPASTQKALDDASIDIAAWLAEEVSIEFAEQEGAAFVNGSGVNQPRGILSYDKVANASYAWGKTGFIVSGKAAAFADASATVSPADAFIDLHYALKQGYRTNASFLMSDLTMGKVRKFKDAEGAFIWAAPSGTAEVATILGKPTYTDDNMPAVGANNFPIAFGDFNRAYMIADRIGIRVLRDPFTSKPNVLFYTTKRVGGGITNFEAIKLMKISA